MPTPEEAAAILRQSKILGGFDPVALAVLRDARKGEAEDNLANDLATNDVPDAKRQTFIAHNLGQDMETDPYTGNAERARVAGINAKLASANPNGPDAQVADAVAKRNAFADFLKAKGVKMGGYEADASPAALRAAQTPMYAQTSDVGEQLANEGEARKTREAQASAGVKPLDAASQKQLIGYHDQASLATDVLPVVRKLADAQDEFNKSTFGSLPTMLTGIPGIAGAAQSAWQNTLYNHGLAPDDVSTAMQHLGLAQAKGVTSFAGRPTAQWLELLKAHLAVPGLPWREEERRLASMVEGTDETPAILPEMENNVYAVRSKQRLAPGAPPQPTYTSTDPNRGRQ